MHEKLISLRLPFILSLCGSYLLPHLIPEIRFLGFAPFIVLAISRLSLSKALWCALFAGVLIDLYSMAPSLGFSAISYTITSLIIYQYKKLFLEEKPTIFALYAVLFSFVSTTIQFVLYALIDVGLHLNLLSFSTDFVIMPLLDGIYTLVLVLLPMKGYDYLTNPERVLLYKIYLRRYKRLIRKQLEKVRQAS